MYGLKDGIAYLSAYKGRPLRMMEVCGTHTSTAFKGGVRSLLGDKIRLVSGPGCPVCLASAAYIDKLCDYALDEGYMVAAFGDLLKVKGTKINLLEAKAQGGNVKMIYAPLEALNLAAENRDKTVVLAAVGFETTAPSYALLLQSAIRQGITNICLLTALKRLIPAMEALCSGGSQIDAFIAPGHVAAIIGSDIFRPLAERFRKPFAVTGFTPENMIAAICILLKEIENNACNVYNLYGEVVAPEGNTKALRILDEAFESGETYWRGLSALPDSGLYLKAQYAAYDAGSRGLNDTGTEKSACRCPDVLTGKIDPPGCPLFGKACTPENAFGPCMVSLEGACGIWYRAGGVIR